MATGDLTRWRPYSLLRYFLALVCVLTSSDIYLQPPDTIFITPDFKHEYFGSKCVHYFQPDKILDPIQLRGGIKVLEKNHRLKTDQYNVLKAIVVNLSDNDQSMLLFLHNVQIDEADVLLYHEDKLIYRSLVTGCTMPGNKRPNYHRTLALPLIFKQGLVYDMYIRVYRKEFGITVSPNLVNPVTGIDFRWTDFSFLIVISSSIFLAFLGLVLFYYGNLRKISQKDILVFVIYSLLSAFYVIAASGYGSLYLWGAFPAFELNAAIFFGALSGSAFMYLCSLILKISQWNKWLGIWFEFISVVYVAVSLLGFFLYNDQLPNGLLGSFLSLLYMIVILNMIVIITITVKKIWFDGEKNYYWFLFIFFFYIVYTIIVIALEIGMIRYNFEFHAIRIVSAHFPQLVLLLVFLIRRMMLSIESNAGAITNMRKDITQDIHDEIGSTLTKISLQAHVSAIKFNTNASQADLFGKIESYAVDANQKLRKFLLSISPKYDTLQHAVQDMRDIYLKYSADVTPFFEAQIRQPESVISNTIKNQWLGVFEQICQQISIQKDIQKIHLELQDSNLYEVHFTWNIIFANSPDAADVWGIFSSVKNRIESLAIHSPEKNVIRVKFFIHLKSNRF